MDVPEERLELSRDNSQRLLRPQRLPISPSGPLKSKSKFGTLEDKAANINVSVEIRQKQIKKDKTAI
jgi:hypothetical protein